MGRRVKIGIGVVVALLALLGLNALWVDGKTEEAEVTVRGGRILDLPDGDLQVAEHGSRNGPPIVLLHCYTCAMDWWNGMVPLLEKNHRVITIDLLGHGGSEKPSEGYTPSNQAKVVAEALERLQVREATVVGHSLGGAVVVGLSEQSPELIARPVIIDMPPDNTYDDGFGLSAALSFAPLLGEALWQTKPDFSVRDGLEVAFAPGYEVPDAFVEDLKRMTYTAYDDSPQGNDHFLHEKSLDQRMKATGKPLMVLMGAEEQLVDDPQRALDQYKAAVPEAETHLVPGAGHSPNVERPALTAKYVLRFAEEPQIGLRSSQHRASGVRSATGRQ
ncbi:MAG TPA: alpha/beta hydrolase [Solirubrobacterales bacterium]|nr:alpha/beta hydrolase [Solirubrobacterales bacterium]